MAELIDKSGFQEFTLEDLKTSDGLARLNYLMRQLADNSPSDFENVRIFQGYGTPESAITAGIGSLYMRVDGAAGTTLYQKQSGTGNTGWIAVPGGGGGFGDVVGPSSATNNDVVLFDGTTGKLIKDSGLTLSGTNTGDQLVFKTISVSGQSDVVADTATDTLTLVGGTNITITTNASTDTITITSAGGGISWTEVTGTSQSAAVNNGYITNNASLVTVTIPTTAAVGSIVRVAGSGAGGWKIAQNASETILWNAGAVAGTNITTAGTGGSLASTDRYDAVEIICISADTSWSVITSKGNITIT